MGKAPSKTDFLKSGAVLGGTYRVTRFLGSGGMGVVYEAEHVRTGRALVAKVLRPVLSLEGDLVERFQREARAAARIGHPGIVEIVDVNQDETGLWYIIMEKLDGRDLAEIIQGSGPLPVERALFIAKKMLEALGEAHEHGILHRDIKPANVFLAKVPEGEQVKLLDFGISKVLSEGTDTTTGLVLGTPLYMAPEQACGEGEAGPAADIFSCGAVIYEMLAGRSPFEAENTPAIIVKLMTTEPVPVSAIQNGIPAHVERAVLAALSKDPGQRPGSAREFIQALDQADDLFAATQMSMPPAAVKGKGGGTDLRTVTVVIFSLGSTSREVGEVTPDMIMERLQEVIQSIRGTVGRHGGLVERTLGDSVVAIFGAPRASGDDGVRAVRAALDVRDGLVGSDVGLRTAVGTGRVIAGHLEQVSAGYTVLGDALNVARRIEGFCDQGEVLIDQSTAQRVKGRFKLEGTGLVVQASGTSVSRVLHEWPHGLVISTREIMGVTTDMVGRDAELALLKSLYERCLEAEQLQTVVVSGAPGIGKSRLAQEFREKVEESSQDVVSFYGGADPGLGGSPHGLIAGMFRLKLGIQAGDKKEKIEECTEQYLKFFHLDKDPVFYQVFSGLKLLLGVTSGVNDKAVDITNVLRLLLDRMGQQYPVVMVLEDLQWADSTSLDVLTRVLDQMQDRPVFMLVMARPEFKKDQGKQLLEKEHCFLVDLRPITSKSTKQLVQQILGARGSESVVDLMVKRSGGTPLFIEELLVDLVDRGVLCELEDGWHLKEKVDTASLPPGIDAILQSRLDALTVADREVLRMASVCGATFWDQAIQALGDKDSSDALSRLVTRDFIVLKPTSKMAGCEEYTFRHILLRDTAYGNLPLREKQELHSKLAKWFAERAGQGVFDEAVNQIQKEGWTDLVDLSLEMEPSTAAPLARHLELGGLRYEASVAYLLAAETTRMTHAFKEAHDNAGRALELANELEDTSLRQLSLGMMGAVLNNDGLFAEAIDYLEKALKISSETGPRHIDGRYMRELAHCYAARQNTARAEELIEMAERVAINANDRRLLTEIEKSRSLVCFFTGRDEESNEHSFRAIELAKEIGDTYTVAVCYHNIGDGLLYFDEFEQARHYLSRSLNSLDQHSMAKLGNINSALLCYIDVVTDEDHEAIDRFQGHIDFAEANGYGWDLMQIKIVYGRSLLHLERHTEAKEQLEAALDMARSRSQQRFIDLCESLIEEIGADMGAGSSCCRAR